MADAVQLIESGQGDGTVVAGAIREVWRRAMIWLIILTVFLVAAIILAIIAFFYPLNKSNGTTLKSTSTSGCIMAPWTYNFSGVCVSTLLLYGSTCRYNNLACIEIPPFKCDATA